MHVAICKDSVADRKQLERLLGRESDLRMSQKGGLYIDSFGNASQLMHNPMLYDVFYIDLCHTPGISSLELVHQLIKKGVTATFVLISSEVNYQTQDFPADVLFLDYPVKPEQLRQTLDEAQKRLSAVVPHIELREDCADINYVTEDEILYAQEKFDFTYVTLTDNRQMRLCGSACSLYAEIEKRHPCFILSSRKVIINCNHIESFSRFGKVVMDDGARFSVPRQLLEYAKQIQSHVK